MVQDAAPRTRSETLDCIAARAVVDRAVADGDGDGQHPPRATAPAGSAANQMGQLPVQHAAGARRRGRVGGWSLPPRWTVSCGCGWNHRRPGWGARCARRWPCSTTGGPRLVRDLPTGGRPVLLCWLKRVWRCPNRVCPQLTWSERTAAIRPRGCWPSGGVPAGRAGRGQRRPAGRRPGGGVADGRARGQGVRAADPRHGVGGSASDPPRGHETPRSWQRPPAPTPSSSPGWGTSPEPLVARPGFSTSCPAAPARRSPTG